MDLNALKAAQQKLDSRGGSEGFMTTKDLTAEGVLFRLLPPPAILNGIFYFPVIKYWMTVNGKRTSIICPSTFGKKSVIQEELDIAKECGDADVEELANDTNNKTGVIRDEEMWMAGLKLEYKTNKAGEILSATVVDGMAKIFQCGKPTLVSEMIKQATGPKATRMTKGAEDGIADREVGVNLLLCKTGKDLATKYAATLDEQMEMDPKWYKNIPDAYEIAKAQMKNPSFQRALIRQFLYGEEIPADVQKKEDERAAKVKEAFKASQAGNKANASEDEDEAPKKKAKKPAVDDDDAEEEVPKKKSAKKPAVDDDDEDVPAKKVAKKKPVTDDDDEDVPAKKVAKKKPAVDDDDDLDEEPVKKPKKSAVFDDDDEDRPEPVAKKSAKKPAVTEDDDDLDEDEDEKPAKNKVAPAPSKAAGKKRSILDDIEDLDDEE